MRVFTAISLPGGIKSRIASAADDMPGPVSAVAKENLHITLHFLGERSAPEAIIGAVRGVSHVPFEAEVRGMSSFGAGPPRVIFANVSDGGGTAELHSAISGNLARAGIVLKEERSYVPHVTIARAGRGSPSAALAKFISSHSSTEFGRFTASSVLVMESTLSSSGPVYKTLCEHKL